MGSAPAEVTRRRRGRAVGRAGLFRICRGHRAVPELPYWAPKSAPPPQRSTVLRRPHAGHQGVCSAAEVTRWALLRTRKRQGLLHTCRYATPPSASRLLRSRRGRLASATMSVSRALSAPRPRRSPGPAGLVDVPPVVRSAPAEVTRCQLRDTLRSHPPLRARGGQPAI